MIDKYLIDKPSSESLLSEYIYSEIRTENFFLEKNKKNNFWYMKSSKDEYYNILSIDTNDMIKKFARSLFNLEFDSMLISGLGLGILPFLCQKTTSIVDVVEVEKEVIDIVEQIGHLNSNVRIYCQNIWNFIPEKKYDIILFDHWMSYAPKEEIDLLNLQYSPYLNENGIITVPIHEQTLR